MDTQIIDMTSNSSSAARHVADLIERLGRLSHTQQFAADLNPAQWEALRYLARANRFSRSPSALAAFLGATKGTISQTLIALERKGLVARRRSENDRRGVILRLTREGEARLLDDPLTALSAAAAGLPPEMQAELARGLRAILGEMQRRNGRRPFGQCASCRFFMPEGASGSPEGPHFCGLLAEPLSPDETVRICHEQEPARAA
jgi:DNA-binding MarR family transcriptional regulator